MMTLQVSFVRGKALVKCSDFKPEKKIAEMCSNAQLHQSLRDH